MGDFNVVEDSIDRLPSHRDALSTTLPLTEMMSSFQLVDRWRETHLNRKEYTLIQKATGSESRIDRKETAIPSDHKMATVKIENYDNPFVGKGRWPWPLHLLNNRKLIQTVKELAFTAQKKMERWKENNSAAQHLNVGTSIQAIWMSLKLEIVKAAKDKSKTMIAPLDRKIRHLERSIKMTLNNEMLDENERMMTAGILGEELKLTLEQKQNGGMDVTWANIHMYSETIYHQWSNQNKERRPRDIISRLKRPEGSHIPHSEYMHNTYASRTEEMAGATTKIFRKMG